MTMAPKGAFLCLLRNKACAHDYYVVISNLTHTNEAKTMTTAITMKVTLNALRALASSCERKSLKLSAIQCHVSNIAFLELRHPCFQRAWALADVAEHTRTFAKMAVAIMAVVEAIEEAIEAAHAEALEMNAVTDEHVRRLKYTMDHEECERKTKCAAHSAIVDAGHSLGWRPRDILRLIRSTWDRGLEAARQHRAAMAAMIAAAPAAGTDPDYELPF